MNYLKSKTCNKWFENCRRQHRPWARCCRAVLLTWEEVHQTRGLHRGAGETRPGEARRPYWWETNKKTDGKIFFSIRFRWFFLINVGNFIFQKKKFTGGLGLERKKIGTWNFETIFVKVFNVCYQNMGSISTIVWKQCAFRQHSNFGNFQQFFITTFDWNGNFKFWWFHRKDVVQI